jgi:hypothetical protein
MQNFFVFRDCFGSVLLMKSRYWFSVSFFPNAPSACDSSIRSEVKELRFAGQGRKLLVLWFAAVLCWEIEAKRVGDLL